MTRRALGPIDAPFALVESESVRKTKESRLSIMNEGWTVSEKTEQRDAHAVISLQRSRRVFIVSLTGWLDRKGKISVLWWKKRHYSRSIRTSMDRRQLCVSPRIKVSQHRYNATSWEPLVFEIYERCIFRGPTKFVGLQYSSTQHLGYRAPPPARLPRHRACGLPVLEQFVQKLFIVTWKVDLIPRSTFGLLETCLRAAGTAAGKNRSRSNRSRSKPRLDQTAEPQNHA